MQTITETINERTTRPILIPLLGEDGAALSDGLVTAITATIRDVLSQTVIRTAEDVLGAHGGTLSGGTLTLILTEADTQVIGTSPLQPRLLTIDVRASGSLRITEEIAYTVRAMTDITPPA